MRSIVKSASGQALLEYVLVLVFITSTGYLFLGKFTQFVSSSVGNLNHILSINLKTGVCETECYFKGYKNENN
ncbi:MAG: hypothetical protein JNM93_10555 [Bacteriovoracaceae bacterium]|nr:hypothetical protein [Bacteriovoracaceae bacterium]